MSFVSAHDSIQFNLYFIFIISDRHLKSIHGENFYSNANLSNQQNTFSYTYFEMIITILLFYIRSFNSSHSSRTLVENSSMSNKSVKISCLQILNKLIKILIQNSAATSASSMNTTLDVCKVQKTILSCLYSTTINLKLNTFNKYILNINSKNDYSFICELYNCVENLIILGKWLLFFFLQFYLHWILKCQKVHVYPLFSELFLWGFFCQFIPQLKIWIDWLYSDFSRVQSEIWQYDNSKPIGQKHRRRRLSPFSFIQIDHEIRANNEHHTLHK